MKTTITSFNSMLRKGSISLSGILKSNFILIVLLAGLTASAHVPPSSNIGGPLRAYTNDSNIVITSQIFGDAAPGISYSFDNNTSGATIVSQSAFQYNSATGIGTQTIIVSPGTVTGSFKIALHVTTAGGTSESSKSVTVIKPDVMNQNSVIQMGGR